MCMKATIVLLSTAKMKNRLEPVGSNNNEFSAGLVDIGAGTSWQLGSDKGPRSLSCMLLEVAVNLIGDVQEGA